MSATVTSGVASFSTKRASRPIQSIGVQSPCCCQHLAAVGGDRSKRIVVDFRAGDDRNSLVEQFGELANDAALCLSAQAEQDDVVPRQNGVDELRNDRFVVTDNARKKFLAGAQFFDQIEAQFVFDREGLIPGRPEFAKSSWVIHILGEGDSTAVATESRH